MSTKEAIISPTGTYAISPSTSPRADEALVRTWGFSHVFTWSDPPNAHYPPHKHSGLTTHLIRRGELTIAYPEADKDKGNVTRNNGGDDRTVKKETFGVGARLDVPAGKVHEVWMGKEGCTYVIGE